MNRATQPKEMTGTPSNVSSMAIDRVLFGVRRRFGIVPAAVI